MGGLLKFAISTALTALLLGMLALSVLLTQYTMELPDYTQLKVYAPSTTTRLYSKDGLLFQEYAEEKRVFVPISHIPKVVVQAFLAAEDRNFYSHPGIDVMGIIRAVLNNAKGVVSGHGSGMQGASTITQQVAKNILLTRERTIERKIKEAILAFRMSAYLSKDRIMELYLNEIYLGSSSYGVATASVNYFNKSLEDLTVEEAALLAALPKAPSQYDPRKNYSLALERRNWVIRSMAEEGFISKTRAAEAVATPIQIRTRAWRDTVKADFFAEEVRRELMEYYGKDQLYQGGLTVYTTLDPKYQKAAENALRTGLVSYDRRHGYGGPLAEIKLSEQWLANLRAVPRPPGTEDWKRAVVQRVAGDSYEIGLEDGDKSKITFAALKWAQRSRKGTWTDVSKLFKPGDVILAEKTPPDFDPPTPYALRQIPKANGAVVVMDPHSGRVLAMTGGFTYENSQFNRATQALRQPGSAFKPFVYLTAMENGLTPANLVADEPIEFVIERTAKGVKTWSPRNFTGEYHGPITIRNGLEHSINVTTVNIAMVVGIDKVLETVKRFRVNDNPVRNLSTMLGATETTLLRLTNAYSMIANGGKRLSPGFIERIQDKDGKTVYRLDQRPCPGCQLNENQALSTALPPVISDNREQVTDPLTAYQMISMMEGVVQRGTSVRARSLNRPIAGKTGTTNESKDLWFIGYTPDLVCGVFMGFDQPRSMGSNEEGAAVALPVFIEFMKQAMKDVPPKPFRIPPGIQLVKIDRTTGFLPSPYTEPKNIILEAFKPGTAPTRYLEPGGYPPVINPFNRGMHRDIDPDMSVSPASNGTGGIY